MITRNSDFFAILVTDAGFVISAHYQPQQVQDLPELLEVCLQEHCVLLHISDKRLCLMCFVQTIEFQNAQMNE